MPAKISHLRARGGISTTPTGSGSRYRNETTETAAIARALAPLRLIISNPPTQADVKAVGDKLDALLAEPRQ